PADRRGPGSGRVRGVVAALRPGPVARRLPAPRRGVPVHLLGATAGAGAFPAAGPGADSAGPTEPGRAGRTVGAGPADAAPAGGGVPALLRRPAGGGDRRRPRLPPRHGQVTAAPVTVDPPGASR